MANVSLKHIYKVYPNGTKAVNDFNMEIEDKEFIVFVGPSGCGKSTTLRMIAGLEDISAGELKIGDIVVNDVEPKDRDIAMVFQNYALYPHMTVYENIAFGLRLRKLPKDEIHNKVLEAAEILGITEYLNKKPKEMSGGQRQRVALGRAIVREPQVMLLDEPLSNLDAKLRTQMRTEISKLHTKLQTTFIYVTHDQVEAMTMGTRIVVMRDGFVQQIDSPKNLYRYPCNKFVAGFIGTPQMNFFVATLLKSGDSVIIAFEGSEAKITVPYSMMYKVKPTYLDGKTKVYIGIRAEDAVPNVSTDKETAGTSGDSRKISKENILRQSVKVKISHKEELGSETLIYGDINLDDESKSDGNTRIVVKDVSGREYDAGDTIEVALNPERIHIFDYETEKSVLPRVPEFNYLDCKIGGGRIDFLGVSVELPKALANVAFEKGELLLPTNAVTFDGNLRAEVVSCEKVNGVYLLSLMLNGNRLYAVSANKVEEKTLNIGIDFKKIALNSGGESVVTPLPELSRLDCKFIKRKSNTKVEENGKIRNKKTVQFGLTVADTFFETSDETSQKIFAALGIKKALSSQMKIECGVSDIAVAQNGIKATVLDILDYGKEKFLKCSVGDSVVYVKSQEEYDGEIYLLPDFDRAGIIETERDIKII